MRSRTKLGLVVITLALTLWGLTSSLRVFAITIPPEYFTVNDLNGADDESGQKDLNLMGRYDDPTAPGYLDFFWSWDEGVSGGNTLDACALFDSNNNQKIDYAICGQVGSDNKLVAGSPKAYSCLDSDMFHCKDPIEKSAVGDDVVAGTLIGLDSEGDLTTDIDPFGPRGQSDYPYDVTLRVRVKSTFLPNAVLTNVCTYSSHTIDTSDFSDCINNVGGGFLRVVKNSSGGDGTFTFKADPVPPGQSGQSCDPQNPQSTCKVYSISTVGGTGNFTIGADASQTESVTEVVPDGWQLNAPSCQVEGAQSTTGSYDSNTHKIIGIAIASGKVTTCTFTNVKQPAKLTVTKLLPNDNGGTAVVGNLTLMVSGQTVVSGQQYGFQDGDYTVSESGGPSGYLATIGGDCAANGSIHMDAGHTYACTITNDDIAPQLTLSKELQISYGGTASTSAWTLSATCSTPATCSGSSVSGFGAASSSASFKAGTYTLAETSLSGYTNGAWTCTGGTLNGNSLTLGLAETASCKVTNSDQPGTLVIKKVVVNNSGGAKHATDFSFSVDGGAAIAFQQDGADVLAGIKTLQLSKGTYSVTEPAVAGYAAGYSNCSGISLNNGETKTCTITNDDMAGTLIVQKVVINDNGGSRIATDFGFKVNGGSTISFQQDGANTLAGKNTLAVDAGSYTITEPDVVGYTTSYDNCSNVSVANGGTQTCTITNNDQAGTLIVQKAVINNNGGTKKASDFSFRINGGSPMAFTQNGANTLAGQNSMEVNAGTYTITEVTAAGYSNSFNNCSSVAITNGETKVCLVTNDDIAPSLTLNKVVINNTINDGGMKSAGDFLLSATGPTSINGQGGAVSAGTFSAGAYSLSEAQLPGYAASPWSCVKNSGSPVSGNAISLSLADTATCTITNTSVNISPNISVDKSASPANLPQAGGDVTFTVKVTNNSALYDPFTLTSLVDDVYGDLTVLEEEPIKKNQLSSTCAVPQTILSKQTYTCTFTAHFNGIPDNQTFYEHDTVIASGIDDDNAGPSSNGTASDDAYVVQSPPIAVTNSSLCSFDTNPDPTVPGRQFKRLFTQDALNMPYYRLTATNPGQFYYNLSLSGTPGDVVHIALTLPWPFVTQGARPIHVYDSVGLQSATGGPSTPDDFCFVPGNETQVINKHVVLASNTLPSNTVQYGAISVPGGGYPKTAILEFDITIPATGFAYVNQHMDDGLKGPKVDVTGDGVADSLYYGNLKDNAVYPTSTGPNVGKVLIPELFNHTFSVAWTGGAVGGGSDTVQNDNEFKKNTGVAGRVTSDSTGDGIAGLTVQLFEGPTATGSPVFTATTDADGWYVMAYKHKGKETTYTVKVVTNVQALTPNPATTTLKANGFAEVNFVLP